MTERHDDNAGNGRRLTTGEFRAAPDISASTAQFRAFAEDPSNATGTWGVGMPDRSTGKIAMLVGGAMLVLAIIAIIAFIVG